jgi:hypothetical protein
MSRKRMVGVMILLVTTTGGARVWNQAGSITGEVMVRERANGDQSLLFRLVIPDTMTVDEIRLRGVGSFRFATGLSPDGWGMMQDGGELRMQGMPRAGTFLFRFDVTIKGRDRLDQRLGGRELEARGFSGGRRMFELKFRVTVQQKVVVQDTLETSLFVPRRIVSGSPFFVAANPGYTAGRWSYGYANSWHDLARADDLRGDPSYERLFSADFRNQPSLDGYRFELMPFTYDLSSKPRLRFAYDDEWGDTLVDAEAAKTAIEPARSTCPPGIRGGSPMVFAGQPLCMSGCFPQPVGSFTLNGAQMVYPAAWSLTSVEVLLPNDLTHGPGRIEMGGASTPYRFVILGLLGTIDQNLLWKGQSTTMRLEILGTDTALPIEIINRTPGIIDVEGGVRHVALTAGGSANAVTRSVRGIHKGNFTINYRLTNEACGFDDE